MEILNFQRYYSFDITDLPYDTVQMITSVLNEEEKEKNKKKKALEEELARKRQSKETQQKLQAKNSKLKLR